MILQCPECHTRYLVPDAAIGTEGRTVRCANCRHSWHQELPAAEPADAPPRAGLAEVAPPPPPPPISSVAPPAAAPAEPVAAPAIAAPLPDAFAPRPPFRPRRNPARLWTAAAVAAAALMLAVVAAILYLGAPSLATQFGLPVSGGTGALQFVQDPIQRRELPNGSELFAISGRIVNASATAQRVPDIRADLLDNLDVRRGRVVYSWTITPQQRTLAPHASLPFNSAKLDVPASSRSLMLSFAGEER